MSLEVALNENTTALKAMTASLDAANAGRDAAVANITNAVAPKTAPKKTADKAPDAAPAHATAVTTTVDKTPAGPMTVDTFRTKIGALISVDEPEKTKRKGFLKAVNDHFGVATVVEVAPSDYAKIVGWFEDMIAGKTVNFSAGEDGQGAAAAEDDDGIG